MFPEASRIQLVEGDITRVDADAIVTAANEALRGGGGVDGAIHRAAGSQLVAASRALAPCPAGQARITAGFELDAKYVIHAVGPIFRNLEDDSAVLASAYSSALALAAESGVRRIAFPCISTGIYGFPKPEACQIAIAAARDWLQANELPECVLFCCYLREDFALYQQRLVELGILSDG